jgi:hypothetical protein
LTEPQSIVIERKPCSWVQARTWAVSAQTAAAAADGNVVLRVGDAAPGEQP